MNKSNIRAAAALFTSSIAISCAYAQTAPIYPATSVAHSDIQAALTKAAHQHKRVILDFGGNWCGDCHALNDYFHRKPNAALLDRYFILVDVNIGKVDENLDIAKKYEVPLGKGVPALAVLDSDGHLLHSQKNGEFEAMRTMDITSVTQFLNQWRKGGTEDKKSRSLGKR